MRRALSILLALCVVLPGAASAKVLIVDGRPNLGADAAPLMAAGRAWELRRVTQILDATGATYKVVPPRIAKTEFVRSGVMVWNYGSPGAYTESFDAVIHLGSGAMPTAGAYRPDSLLKGAKASEAIGTGTTKAPAVPQLFLGETIAAAVGGLTEIWDDGTGAGLCTTGVSNGSALMAIQLPAEQVMSGLYQVGKPERWMTSSYVGGWLRNTAPAGGFRVHIARTITLNLEIRHRQAGVFCSDCDSLVQSDSPDTLVLWERMMTHVTGAKPVVFAWATGAAPCIDSTGAFYEPCEGEASILLAALSRLDSLSGGNVLGPKPIQWGLTIDGGFSRSGRRHSGGLFCTTGACDSTSLKATIDSLHALNIPAVLNVNVDSVASYPYEKSWWKTWRKLRFAPQTRYGLDSTVAGQGNASWLKPADVWGRWRSRLAYQNSVCTGAADTSVYCLLKSQFYRMDSIPEFAGRTSRFLSAPDDDWLPVNKLGARGADSVLFAAILAGASGIRVNSQEEPLGAYGPDRTTNPKGWYGQQRWHTPLAGEYLTTPWTRANPNSGRIKLLAHSGHSIAGSALQSDVRSDSTAPYYKAATVDFPWVTIPAYELHRIWGAGLYKSYHDRDIMTDFQISSHADGAGADAPWGNVNKPLVDQIVGIRHGNIIRMSVQEFAGNPDGPATRPGYWTIKSMVHAQRVINRLANRNIVGFALPEDIIP